MTAIQQRRRLWARVFVRHDSWGELFAGWKSVLETAEVTTRVVTRDLRGKSIPCECGMWVPIHGVPECYAKRTGCGHDPSLTAQPENCIPVSRGHALLVSLSCAVFTLNGQWSRE